MNARNARPKAIPASWLTFTALAAASVAGWPARAGGVGPFLAELGLLVLGAWLALRAAPHRRAREATPVLRVAAVLIALLCAGQIARTKKAFPLIPYTMYGRAREQAAELYTYRAVHASGARTAFRPSAAYVTLGNGRAVKGLAQRLDRIAALEQQGSSGRADSQVVHDLIGAVARRLNREQARDPIVRVEVVRVVLPPPFRPAAAREQVMMAVAVGGPP